jgi:hypothetical protein
MLIYLYLNGVLLSNLILTIFISVKYSKKRSISALMGGPS